MNILPCLIGYCIILNLKIFFKNKLFPVSLFSFHVYYTGI